MQKVPFRPITRLNIEKEPEWGMIPSELKHDLQVVSAVLPFRTNPYVMRQLIDWDNVPDDPIFQLNFLQRNMLAEADFAAIENLLATGASKADVRALADSIRKNLNPHPGGQRSLNVPEVEGSGLPGVQHKYKETLLYFPKPAQTCHAYCTFCFRWAQFVGIKGLRFEAEDTSGLIGYLKRHTEVTDVLITGGDPLIMNSQNLSRSILPLLDPALEHVRNIRIGTKALAYWPYRFLTDLDADELLAIFEKVVDAGKHLALMVHFNHPVELSPPIVIEAIRRVQRTGAVIRMQSPIIRRINDAASVWIEMWTKGIQLGCVPYYMFVERDTGPRDYFGLPLSDTLRIFTEAYSRVSGLARTVRGPSATIPAGKVLIDGVLEMNGSKVFVLKFIQARESRWVGKPFLATFDEAAVWIDQLKPASGETLFFFEKERPDLRTLDYSQTSGRSQPSGNEAG